MVLSITFVKVVGLKQNQINKKRLKLNFQTLFLCFNLSLLKLRYIKLNFFKRTRDEILLENSLHAKAITDLRYNLTYNPKKINDYLNLSF